MRKPGYRRQRRKNRIDLAFIEVDGQRIYLGDYGSDESRREYRRLAAELLVSRGMPAAPEQSITVKELLELYRSYAMEYYGVVDGRSEGEFESLKPVLKVLEELYGHTDIADFGPRALKALRELLIDRGGSRKYVNQNIGRIKRLFKWAVSEEMLDPAVFHSLQAVEGLRAGRTRARETDPVRVVSQSSIDAVEPYVSRQVWGLIRLQLLTGARPGEVVGLRASDLDTRGEIWTCRLSFHKTAYRGHERTLYFGPKAQEVLKEFMADRPLNAVLFSASEAVTESRAKRRALRKTPLKYDKRRKGKRRKSSRRKPGESYSVRSYSGAIRRACEKAGISRWTANQLRHNAATYIRREFGLDAARVILGHKSAAITEVYAEMDREKAVAVVGRIG